MSPTGSRSRSSPTRRGGALAATAGPAMAAPAAPPASAPSNVGAAALRVAMTQLGKPYVWGAAGPNAYDCSGLVQWSFKRVGVNLPRVASMQSTVGTPV